MSKLEKIVEDLSALTVLEAAELSKLLEEKWGVSAAAPVAVAAPVAAAPVAAEGSFEDKLRKLKAAFEAGLLTEDEYKTKKAKLVDSL